MCNTDGYKICLYNAKYWCNDKHDYDIGQFNFCNFAEVHDDRAEQKKNDSKTKRNLLSTGNLPCDNTCTAYLKYAFQHGLAEDDVSAWCTSGLDFCYSGNCLIDCEHNLHEGRHWNNVDCTAVCHGARKNRQLEEQKVEEQNVEVAAPAPAQKDLPCDITCPAYLKFAFQHGMADYDVSAWCTSGLDLCYSGNCMSDCEYNLHDGHHWNNVDCRQVCHNARGATLLI
jgi:hypothetical protein